jgi:hypothetical protein
VLHEYVLTGMNQPVNSTIMLATSCLCSMHAAVWVFDSETPYT